MAVILKSITTFQRISLLLMDDAVIKLEHERTQDRVRRYPFESIQAVIIWQKISWWRIIVCIVLLMLPGVGLLFVAEQGAIICGAILMLIGGALVLWYIYCKVATIRIVRGGSNYDLTGLFRPGKLRKFRTQLLAGIDTTQSASF